MLFSPSVHKKKVMAGLCTSVRLASIPHCMAVVPELSLRSPPCPTALPCVVRVLGWPRLQFQQQAFGSGLPSGTEHLPFLGDSESCWNRSTCLWDCSP